MMFQHRATEFDPRVSAIAGHLRAIEKGTRRNWKKRQPKRIRERVYRGQPDR